MNTQGIVSTTFGMRIFTSLETTLREQSVNTLTLEREVFLFHARGAESLIIDPSSLVNVNKRPTPSDQTGGSEPQGGPMVPKKPKGKQPKALVVPTVTPFKSCFYDVEFKAKISGSKGCSANLCNFGVHHTDVAAYLRAAGSKSRLITSLASFRQKDRLRAVVDVIKVHP